MKKVIIALIVLLVVLVGAGFMLPASTHIERSTIINADQIHVFGYVNNLRKFNQWSPWAEMDPNTKYTFSGPAAGVGAILDWDSEHREVGAGRNKIIESVHHSRVAYALDFGDMGQAQAAFTLAPAEQGVKVTWAFHTEHGMSLINRFFGAFFMEGWLSGDYEKGLANLKTLAESTAAATASTAEIKTEEVSYEVDGVTLKGYLAYKDSPAKRPGVLVVHEWWGHNDYARRRAEMLAALGYTAFALDMYGDGKLAEHPKDATTFMMEVVSNAGVAKARFEAAANVLKQHSSTNAEQLAAIGYCFGGATVLGMARSGIDLDAVVSFHGSLNGLPPVNQDAEIDTRILILNGAADPFVKAEHKQAFQEEMQAAGLQYELIDYPDVVHSFTNPGADEKAAKYDLPLKYDAAADKDSWQRMQALLADTFE